MTPWYAQPSPHHRHTVLWQNVGMPLFLAVFASIVVTWAYHIPTTTHLDLGTGEEHAYLHAFTAPETNGVYNYVFSTSGARMHLENIGDGQHVLRIRMSGWRPPEAEPARLMLRVNHQRFSTFLVAPEPRQYHIPIYVKTNDAVVQWFSTTFVPDTEDARQLGVAIDWVAVQALQVHPTTSDYINVLLILLLLYGLLRSLHLMPVYAFAIPCGSVLIALVVAVSGTLGWRDCDLELMWVALALLHLIIHLVQVVKAHCKVFFSVPEYAFALLGIVFGIMFIFVTPPFQAPDEPGHFLRAYQLSEGRATAPYYDEVPRTYDLLPRSTGLIIIKLLGDIPFHPDKKQSVENIVSAFAIPLNQEHRDYILIVNVSLYPPVPYFPQALGIASGRLLDLPPLLLFYIGRLSNLLVATLLTFLAIKTTPVFKWFFVVLALVPMVAYQRSTVSADAFTNSITLLLTAFFLQCAFDKEKLKRQDFLLLFALSLGVALSKQTFFIIIFLYFLIPVNKVGTIQKYIAIFGVLMTMSLVATSTWSSSVKDIYLESRTYFPNKLPLPNEQLQFILSNPVRFGYILVKDYIQRGPTYFRMFIGNFGWLDTPLPVLFQISYGIVLIGIALIDGNSTIVINSRNKVVISVVFALGIALVSTTLYIYRNPLGADYINVQGRQLIPLASLPFLLLYNRKLCFDIRTKHMHLLLIGYMVFSFVLTLYVIIDRYYLPVAAI